MDIEARDFSPDKQLATDSSPDKISDSHTITPDNPNDASTTENQDSSPELASVPGIPCVAHLDIKNDKDNEEENGISSNDVINTASKEGEHNEDSSSDICDIINTQHSTCQSVTSIDDVTSPAEHLANSAKHND